MVYESPAVQYQGAFNDVLRRLFPLPRKEQLSVDRRIMKLLHFIDSNDGSIGWDLVHACRELRLDISGAYAARLFKRCTGLGVREDSKKRRLLMAGFRFTTTHNPTKTIHAEFRYPASPPFTASFIDRCRSCPPESLKR